MDMLNNELERSCIPENSAHISVDSSKKVLNVLSKFSYDTETLKRIVGAVTILFVDNDSREDSCDDDDAGESGTSLLWKNIPSTLSVLPNPRYHSSGHVAHQLVDADNPGGQDNDEAISPGTSTVSIKQESPREAGYVGTTVLQNCLPTATHKSAVDLKFANQTRRVQSRSQDFSVMEADRRLQGRASQSSCSVCSREIRTRKDFIFHAKAHKTIMGGGECCPICFKTFVRNVGLIRHSNVHSTNEYYCCPVCKINIMQLDSLKRHFHKRHPGSLAKLKQYLVTSRPKTTQSSSGIGHVFGPETSRDHEKVDSPASQSCNKIPKYDRNRRISTYRQYQAQRQSNGQRMHSFGVGSSGFESSISAASAVSAAQDMQEPDISSYAHFGRNKTPLRNSSSTNLQKSSTCSFCWSPMNNLEEYLGHMDSHRHLMNVPNTCPVCLHEFSDKMRVKRHASRHVQTAVYSCPLCRIQIPRVDSFRRHVRKVHPEHTEIINIEHSYKHTPPSQSEQMSETPDKKLQSVSMTCIKKELSSPSEDPESPDEMLYTVFDPNSESVLTKLSPASPRVHPASAKTSSTYSGFTSEPSSGYSKESEPQCSSFSSESEALGEMTMPNIQSLSTVRAHDHNPPSVGWQLGVAQHQPQGSLSSSGLPPGLISTCSKDTAATATMSAASFHAPRGRGAVCASKSDLKDVKPDHALQSRSIPSPSSSGKKQVKNKQLSSVCFFCSAILTSTREFLEHARLHAEADKITCPVCVTDYARKLGLMRHSVNHVPSDAHICTICGTSFARRDVMLRHYRKVHRVLPDYVSPTKSTDSATGVQEQDDLPILSFDSITAPSIPPLPGDVDVAAASMHVVDDEEMMYSCGLCGAQYHDAQSLQEHVQNHPHDI